MKVVIIIIIGLALFAVFAGFIDEDYDTNISICYRNFEKARQYGREWAFKTDVYTYCSSKYPDPASGP